MQDDVYENEFGFIFRGLVRSRFRAAEAAVRLAPVPTQAVRLMPRNTAGITSIQKRVGWGEGDVEGGVNINPLSEAREVLGMQRRRWVRTEGLKGSWGLFSDL